MPATATLGLGMPPKAVNAARSNVVALSRTTSELEVCTRDLNQNLKSGYLKSMLTKLVVTAYTLFTISTIVTHVMRHRSLAARHETYLDTTHSATA